METLTEYRMDATVRFNEAQESFLCEYLLQGEQLPDTVAELEAVADNDAGITQAHLDQFRTDVRYGIRCDGCGTLAKGTDDTCGDCVIGRDEA